MDEFLLELERPLLAFEVAADERAKAQLAALMRGEINVA